MAKDPESEVTLSASVIRGDVSQEMSDRIAAIVHPMAETILNLDPETMDHVMGSLLSSYAFRFDHPEMAVFGLCRRVLATLSEAQAQMDHKPN